MTRGCLPRQPAGTAVRVSAGATTTAGVDAGDGEEDEEEEDDDGGDDDPAAPGVPAGSVAVAVGVVVAAVAAEEGGVSGIVFWGGGVWEVAVKDLLVYRACDEG